MDYSKLDYKYDKKIKRAYLADPNTAPSNVRITGSYFKQMETVEQKVHQSIFDMDIDTLLDYTIEDAGLSYSTWQNNCNSIKSILPYAYHEHYRDSISKLYDGMLQREKEYGFLANSRTLTENYRKWSFGNPQQLSDYMKKIFQPITHHRYDNILRGFVWLLYMGVNPKDAVMLNKDDVDLSKMVVSCNGRQYRIYEESLRLFKELKNIDYYIVSNSRADYVSPYIDPKKFLGRSTHAKENNGDKINENQVRNVSLRLRERTADEANRIGFNRLTIDRIVTAGFFYVLYSQEQNGIQIRWRDLPSKRNSIRTQQLNPQYTLDNPRAYKTTTRVVVVQREYEAWKEAFRKK